MKSLSKILQGSKKLLKIQENLLTSWTIFTVYFHWNGSTFTMCPQCDGSKFFKYLNPNTICRIVTIKTC